MLIPLFLPLLLPILPQLETISEAIFAVKNSRTFNSVLEIVLAIGNYMNGSTPRGAAWGFKLDCLLKLSTIKSSDQKRSLMHYLATLLERKYADLLNIFKEIESVKAAAEITSDQVGKKIAISTNDFVPPQEKNTNSFYI